MNLKRKLFIVLISIICIFSMKTVVKAESTGYYHNEITNPLYENIDIKLQKKTINASTKKTGLEINEEQYIDDMVEIAKTIRDNAINRQTSFSVYMKTETNEQLNNNMIDEYAKKLFEISTSEELAENSSGGDYLKWSWYKYSYSANCKTLNENNKYTNYITFNIEFIFFTTYEQEKQLDNDIRGYINGLDKNLSDYEKIKTIYNYITGNVKYDNENLNNESYILKYSAYAAFENKTAVCQGYANLLYKMLKECSVSGVRIVASSSHAWNIVKFDKIYYCVDSTWDAECKSNGLDCQFFLKGLNTFNNLREHTMQEEYFTTEFVKNYPISNEDYTIPNNEENNNGENGTGNNGNGSNGETESESVNEINNSNQNQSNNNLENNTNVNTNTDTSINKNSGDNTNNNSKSDIINITYTNPSKVTGFTIKDNYTNKVKLRWDKQPQATQYKIYLYNNKTKKYECKKTLNGNTTTATIKGLTDGTTYTFKIQAINGNNVYGEYTKFKVTTKPKKAKISKLKATAKNKLTVNWKKIANSNGYMIQYSTNSKFKNAKKIQIKNKKTISKVIKSLKRNKKYYIRIRAYRQVDGKKIYGDYCKTKKIKLK